jgi:hypothetical protein
MLPQNAESWGEEASGKCWRAVASCDPKKEKHLPDTIIPRTFYKALTRTIYRWVEFYRHLDKI